MGCNSSRHDVFAARERDARLRTNDDTDDSSKGSVLCMVETTQFRHRWLASENKKLAELHPDDIPKFERLFRKLLKDEASSEEAGLVTQSTIERTFVNMGLNMQKDLLEKVFSIFDVDGVGKVDHTAFVVGMAYLMRRSSTKDNVALLFRLFDTDCSNRISQVEFNSMISAIVSNRLEDIIELEVGIVAFMEHLENEFCTEPLRFWLDVNRWKKTAHGGSVDTGAARAIYDTYISETSNSQINVASKITKRLSGVFSASSVENLSASLFDDALKEVISGLEKDNYARFKHKLARNPNFAKVVWKEMGIRDGQHMTLDQFGKWSKRNSAVFNFLAHLQDEMSVWLSDEQRRKSRVGSGASLATLK